MNKKNVAVLYGGVSSEHDVSKVSAANIISNIPDDKYNIIPVYITKEGRWLLYDGIADNVKYNRLEKLGTPAVLSPDRQHGGLIRIVGEKTKLIPIDVVFPVMHGRFGEDGSIQGLCELSGIPYVGCGVLASAVAMDKGMTKLIASKLSIPQAKYRIYNNYEEPKQVFRDIRYKIGYPCFIKPACSGSSIGISLADSRKTLESAVVLAFGLDKKIIAEKPVIGREFECAILGTGINGTKTSGIGEIVYDRDFYDFEAKYAAKQSKSIIPADIPDEIAESMRQIAVRIYNAIDGFGLSRADFFWNEETGEIFFNEINTIPGFTSISMYQKLWEQEGLFLPELLDVLIEAAFDRY